MKTSIGICFLRENYDVNVRCLFAFEKVWLLLIYGIVFYILRK